MDVQIADQSGKPLQLPPAEKKVFPCSTLCMAGNFMLLLYCLIEAVLLSIQSKYLN